MRLIFSSLRRLSRSPSHVAGVLVVLTLGLGLNATLLSIATSMLSRRPPGVVQPDALRWLYVTPPPVGGEATNVASLASYSEFRAVAAALRGAADVQAVLFATTLGVMDPSGARAARMQVVSDGYFAMLGLRPSLGALPLASESPSSLPRVVVSHEEWRTRWAGRPDIVGQTIAVNGMTTLVAGVLPLGFAGLETQPASHWILLADARQLLLGPEFFMGTSQRNLALLARPSAGVPLEVVIGRAQAVIRALDQDAGAPTVRQVTADDLTAQPGFPRRVSRYRAPGFLAGLALLILFVASTNTAGLVLAHSARRAGDLGVRRAIGASDRRLLLERLTDAAWLAVGAAVLGSLASLWLRQALTGWLGISPGEGWPLPVVGAASALAAFASIALVASAPLLRLAQHAATPGVGARRSTAGRAEVRTLRLLAVVQVACSAGMLHVALLNGRSAREAAALPLGFEPRGIVSVSAELAPRGYRHAAFASSQKQLAAAQRQLDVLYESLSGLPLVARAALAAPAPFEGASFGTVAVEDPGGGTRPVGAIRFVAVSADYFQTLGMRVLHGRPVLPGDVAGAARVAVINVTMAQRVWPNASPLGQCIQTVALRGHGCATIVGVVNTARQERVEEPDEPMLYVPLAQAPQERVTLLLRSRSTAAALRPEVERAMGSAGAALTSVRVGALEDEVARVSAPWRRQAILYGLLSILSLTLASAGLFAFLSFLVDGQRRDLGIRSALGAPAMRLLRGALGTVLLPVAAGLAVSIPVVQVLLRLRAPEFVGVAPAGGSTWLATSCIVTAVALAAALVPALRVLGTDPAEVLRADG